MVGTEKIYAARYAGLKLCLTCTDSLRCGLQVSSPASLARRLRKMNYVALH